MHRPRRGMHFAAMVARRRSSMTRRGPGCPRLVLSGAGGTFCVRVGTSQPASVSGRRGRCGVVLELAKGLPMVLVLHRGACGGAQQLHSGAAHGARTGGPADLITRGWAVRRQGPASSDFEPCNCSTRSLRHATHERNVFKCPPELLVELTGLWRRTLVASLNRPS